MLIYGRVHCEQIDQGQIFKSLFGCVSARVSYRNTFGRRSTSYNTIGLSFFRDSLLFNILFNKFINSKALGIHEHGDEHDHDHDHDHDHEHEDAPNAYPIWKMCVIQASK